MNFPGILNGDPAAWPKSRRPKKAANRSTDMPPDCGVKEAARYIAAGITTDHECFTKEEALDKLAAGCKISIREGSAARNFAALYTSAWRISRPDHALQRRQASRRIAHGHINLLVRRAVERGIDVFDALQAACLNPIEHYSLDVGQLRVGDPADFIEVDSLSQFNVLRTWIDGQLVAENGVTTIPRVDPTK